MPIKGVGGKTERQGIMIDYSMLYNLRENQSFHDNSSNQYPDLPKEFKFYTKMVSIRVINPI